MTQIFESIMILKSAEDIEDADKIKTEVNRYFKMLDDISKKYGRSAKLDEIGERKLAYDVRGRSTGYYVQFTFTASPEDISTYELALRADDEVLKFITVRVSEDEVDVMESESTDDDELSDTEQEADAQGVDQPQNTQEQDMFDLLYKL